MNRISIASSAFADAEIRRKIRGVLSEAAMLDVPLDALSDDADLYAAGLASITSVRITVALEDEFAIEIPDHLLNRLLCASIDNLSHAVVECLRA
jgi:acyl carrier protein